MCHSIELYIVSFQLPLHLGAIETKINISIEKILQLRNKDRITFIAAQLLLGDLIFFERFLEIMRCNGKCCFNTSIQIVKLDLRKSEIELMSRSTQRKKEEQNKTT